MIAVLFHRFGPYHLARLAAAAKRGDVVGVELSGHGGEYAWKPVTTDAFRRVTVHPGGDTNDLPAAERVAKVEAALEALNPDTLAIAGYSDPGMLAAARWGLNRGKKLVLMSDSQEKDEPRKAWKEWVKRRLVGCFGSSFVAGTTHADYLRKLDMPASRIFTGYDVVDNEYFAAGADAARADPAIRDRWALPDRYFFASARFVAKKNLAGLLDAYAAYSNRPGADPWNLVLAGDGPLRGEVEAQIDRLRLVGRVQLPGFLPYELLPAFYGLASAFVMPSTVDQWGLVVNEAMAAGLPVIVSDACGCAPDLVEDGKNGFAFDAGDTAQLTELMLTLEGDPVAAAAMGRRSRKVIAAWSPERFAESLFAAAAAAVVRRPGPVAEFILGRLLRR